ncbi:hypothetical protein [Tessaracoccus palaemonis]|uniref:Ig-like domain-containing protein n=1 Tax=Tessaracoccus palaemonis TaxID=2829499 RepID=A0ABX8SMG5_9ACTN|nr:hypothetical protein [Tessaracoccus palaemonis]QXT63348.1 hypothetical protein KDB89_02360 [Tessaracoccus palaemonis]
MTHPAPRRLARAALVAATATALAFGGFVAAPAAHADAIDSATPTTVSDAVLTWGLSTETGGGAYDGSCNFLSAGIAGDTTSSRPWTEADGFYQSSVGNVEILKDGPDGTQVTPTWATKCQTGAGTNVVAWQPSTKTGNVVKISEGEGLINSDGSATVSWDGDFSVVFYGGLTYWSASDPVLTVAADGTGQLTATATGYAASMSGGTWGALPATEVVLADLTGVEVTETGFTVTPDYLGVEVEVGTGTAQNRANAYWGAFPQSLVDFNMKTGQSSYWYSSGAARDSVKVATPLTVGYTAEQTTPTVTVSKTTGLDADGETITVTGSGFLPNGTLTNGTRQPLAGKFAGSYIVLGKFADVWQPTAGATSSARTGISTKWGVLAEDYDAIGGESRGAAVINPDGTFEVQLDAKSIVGSGNYGVYTYAGGGVTYAPFETFTPVSFDESPAAITGHPVTANIDVSIEVPSIDHTFSVTATGGPTPTIAWEKRAAGSDEWAPIEGATSNELNLALTAADNGSAVRAVATNIFGTATSDEASITVETVNSALVVGKPTISGSAKVGSTLTAKPGTWTAGTNLSYQWFSGSSAIKGATRSALALTSALSGKSISVKVTGTKDGYDTATASSAAVKVAAGTLATKTPTISGTAKVGRTLTAIRGTWTSGTTYTYQWYAGGSAIKGATGKSFTPTATQKGKKITVKVTGRLSGYTTASKTSKATSSVAAGSLTTKVPTIKGTAKVGKKLTVIRGTWTSGTSYSYQWYANGSKIKGATSKTITVKTAQKGAKITVKVTGRKSGYTTATKVSKATAKVA